MKKKLLAVAIAASGLALLANTSASASGVCYDVNINVNGTPIVHAGCQDVPDLPAAP